MTFKWQILKVCLFLLSSLKISTSQSWTSDFDKTIPEFWSWGFADDTGFFNEEPVKQKVQEITTESPQDPIEEYDPCEPYNPETPDFTNGRRISVAKCHEYIWGMEQRQQKLKRKDECQAKKNAEYLRKCALAGHICSFGGVGGRDTLPGEFPHMGAIGWKGVKGKWKFGCAGSLLSSKFVLTAAHCSIASSADTSIADPVPKIIRFGDKNIVSAEARQYIYEDIKVDAEILRTFVHPQYSAPKKYFDIALMELEKGFSEFTNLIHPACLWGDMDTRSLGNEVTVTGWGVVTEDGVDISPELQAVDIVIVDTPLCNHLLRRRCNRLWCGVQGHQICGGNLTGGVDSCKGDSGGPMQVRMELPDHIKGYMHNVVGITSFGIGCARPNSPAIYTRVASFIDWIERIVWPEQ